METMRTARAMILALAALAAAPQVMAVRAGCTSIDRVDAKADGAKWGIPHNHLDGLHEVFSRISRVSGIRPDMYVCTNAAVNAMAGIRDGKSFILVNVGLMKMIDGDVDEMAAVVGHEFGHLLMEHREKKVNVAQETLVVAAHDAGRMVRRGVDEKSAVRAALTRFVAENMEFSRAAEREADDAGFQLLMRAGYKASGARELSEKMLKANGAINGGYFASHPGWGERAGYNARLQRNEEYRREAEAQLRERAFPRLIATVDRWQKEIPDSGAAAYYRAFHAWLTQQPAERVSASLEEAVAYFDGEGLSRVSQQYQSEASVAALALCVSLYREGRRVETLHCLEKLHSRERVEDFRRITGWNDFILMSHPSQAGSDTLYTSRTARGTVVMTNCRHIAEENGSRQARPWAAARDRADTTKASVASGTAMICSPDMCNCDRIDMNEVNAALRRFEGR